MKSMVLFEEIVFEKCRKSVARFKLNVRNAEYLNQKNNTLIGFYRLPLTFTLSF